MLSAAGNWKESFAPVGKGGRTTAPLLEKSRIMVGSLERVPSVKMATFVLHGLGIGALEASGVGPQSESGNDFKLGRRLASKLRLFSGGIWQLPRYPTGSSGDCEVGHTVPCPFPPPAETDSAGARVAELVAVSAEVSFGVKSQGSPGFYGSGGAPSGHVCVPGGLAVAEREGIWEGQVFFRPRPRLPLGRLFDSRGFQSRRSVGPGFEE